MIKKNFDLCKNDNNLDENRNENKDEESSDSSDETYYKNNEDICGIKNIGNSCYLNSGLQIFASCEELID